MTVKLPVDENELEKQAILIEHILNCKPGDLQDALQETDVELLEGLGSMLSKILQEINLNGSITLQEV